MPIREENKARYPKDWKAIATDYIGVTIILTVICYATMLIAFGLAAIVMQSLAPLYFLWWPGLPWTVGACFFYTIFYGLIEWGLK